MGLFNDRSLPRRTLLGWLTAGLAVSSWHPGSAAARREALPLLLAREASPTIDPSGFLVSEKLDGVRAVWDGRRLRFRSGREVNAPAAWLATLPQVALDGELWLGRRRFDELSGLVRRSSATLDHWQAVRYVVFELPGGEGDFAARARQIEALAARQGGPFLRAAPQRRLASPDQLRRHLDDIVSAGGEGLMLHRADAPYLTGRSDALLKLKPVQDADAVVIGHEPGLGKFSGRTGALRVRGEGGQVFSLGSGLSDRLRDEPPPIGSIVTYVYRGTTRTGLPRFATLLRVRGDL
jgi:DNA ligase 1